MQVLLVFIGGCLFRCRLPDIFRDVVVTLNPVISIDQDGRRNLDCSCPNFVGPFATTVQSNH